MQVEFYKNTIGGRKTIENWVDSGSFQLTTKNYFDEELYSNLIQKIVGKIEEFTCQSSGWIVNKIMQLNVKIVKVNPLKASSYIELPEKYTHSSYGLIYVRNSDNMCFKWSVARHFCTDEKKT